MWYSNTLQFPFQEIYKEYAQISAQKLCLRRFSMQHQNIVWQDIRRWSKQNQNMGLWKHQKNLRSEAEALKLSWYHAQKHFKVRRQEDALHQLLDSDDIQMLFTQTSYQKKVQDGRLR